jgi:hypothetical protein
MDHVRPLNSISRDEDGRKWLTARADNPWPLTSQKK